MIFRNSNQRHLRKVLIKLAMYSGLPLFPGKQALPVFPLPFPHIFRDLSQILFPSRLLTNFKLGGEILPNFL